MIVTVNLMMKSGAALTVYHRPLHTDYWRAAQAMLPRSAESPPRFFEFYRDKKKLGRTFVDMREVAVIEIFSEDV